VTARCWEAPIRAATASRWGTEMRRVATVVIVLLTLCGPATAAEWSGLTPATSTMDTVREKFGAPTRTETQKVDGYDTTTWIYEGTEAPTGMSRMVVDFGLLQARGFQKKVMRSFRLEPHPGVFTRQTVLSGWGPPTGISEQASGDSFYYEDGLVVVFDQEAWSAVNMVFTQPRPSDRAKPSR
jgi:hypothetical protein